MQASAQTISDVTCLIQQESLLLASLIDILKAEKQALVSRQPAELKTQVKQKAEMIIELEKYSSVRALILSQGGYQNTKEGWETLMGELNSQGAALESEWEKLRTLIKKSHDLNLVNAKIVNRTKNTVERFLNIFKGKTEAPELYNQMGNKSSKIRAYTVQAPVVKA